MSTLSPHLPLTPGHRSPHRRLDIPPHQASPARYSTAMSQASQSSGSTPQELMSYIEKQPPPAPDPHSFVPDAHGVRHGQSQTPRQHGIEHSRQQVRPFFAGESQGLEFLFDVIAPDRCTRGLHYATPASKYRSKRTCRTASYHQPELPPATIQQELVRCFFHYVWPAMPVIDAADFLTAWWREQSQVSPLLLWSVFFAAASFIDSEVLKAQHMPPKMALKEQYYQNAKDLHDSRAEPDKTVLMQSALLLSTWYIDLEDRDGLTHWIGIALSLAHTIGLHRKDNYGAIHPPPFPERLRRIWRNIWWSTYYRDTWASFGLGRPMRISSEDCDAPLPSTVEVFGEDIEHLPPELRLFLPSHLQDLANLWLNFIELTTHLENITKTYYRPRSRTPTKEQVEQAEQVIMASRDQLYMPRFHDAPVLAVHALHVRAYYRLVRWNYVVREHRC